MRHINQRLENSCPSTKTRQESRRRWPRSECARLREADALELSSYLGRVSRSPKQGSFSARRSRLDVPGSGILQSRGGRCKQPGVVSASFVSTLNKHADAIERREIAIGTRKHAAVRQLLLLLLCRMFQLELNARRRLPRGEGFAA